MDVIELYNRLPLHERAQLDRMIAEEAQKTVWAPLVNEQDPDTPTPQAQAYHCKADFLLYGGPLHVDTNVLTPFGWKRIGSMKKGDVICATDGTTQEVIGHYPQGVNQVYKMMWSDGSETICDGSHLWLMWKAGKGRKSANKKVCGAQSSRKWVTSDIYDYYTHHLPQQKRKIKLGIPVISSPVRFNVAGEKKGPHKFLKRSFPPYVLGVLLGDGSLTGGVLTFCTPDLEVLSRVEASLKEYYGEHVRVTTSLDPNKDKALYRCYIPKEFGADLLDDLGVLGCASHEKFIPRIYQFATVAERWELLRGLMDSDGWSEEDGDCYYCTTSPQLLDDIRQLARSLGAITHRRERDPFYSYNGERLQGLRAYTLRIKMPDNSQMFHLKRKKQNCEGKDYQSMGIWLESIEPCGEAETVCISVSHQNSLYVIDDYIVTHNSAGGGKSSLAIGLALTAHNRSLILRRESKQTNAMVDEIIRLRGTRKGYNGQLKRFDLGDGKTIQLGGCQYEHNKEDYRGIPFDLYVFDEASAFTESQFRFITAWNRTTNPNQRCRVVAASNPPSTAEGQWLIKFWAPWLDPTHPNPALPGELRWFVTDSNGDDIEVDGPEPVEIAGELLEPKSRTFIPSSVEDNPFLMATGYKKQLQALPEPLRSQMLKGDFTAGREDSHFQVIPRDWVEKAFARWKETRPDNCKNMSAMGVDPARGGRDKTVFACRYGNWYDKLKVHKGVETPEGSDVAALAMQYVRDGAPIFIDIIGGEAPYEHMKANNMNVHRIDGRKASHSRALSGLYGFANKRSELWWRFREALDPSSKENVALPPDPELMGDLCAPRYSLTSKGIQVESKGTEKCDDKGNPTGLIKRLGRSPDKGDAVVYAWCEGSAKKPLASLPRMTRRKYNPHNWRR